MCSFLFLKGSTARIEYRQLVIDEMPLARAFATEVYYTSMGEESIGNKLEIIRSNLHKIQKMVNLLKRTKKERWEKYGKRDAQKQLVSGKDKV